MRLLRLELIMKVNPAVTGLFQARQDRAPGSPHSNSAQHNPTQHNKNRCSSRATPQSTTIDITKLNTQRDCDTLLATPRTAANPNTCVSGGGTETDVFRLWLPGCLEP